MTSIGGLRFISDRESLLSCDYFHACKALLTHFHFAYNGPAPLLANPEDILNLMTHEQLEYLRDIEIEVFRQGSDQASFLSPNPDVFPSV